MNKLSVVALLSALAVFPALAQTPLKKQPPVQPPAPQAAAAAPTANQAPADAAPVTVETTAFGAWRSECRRSADRRVCTATLSGADAKTHALTIIVAITRDKDDKVVFNLATPPNLSIATGVSVSLDSQPFIALTPRACEPRACHSAAMLDPKKIDAIALAKSMRVEWVDADGGQAYFEAPIPGASGALQAASLQ